MKKDKRFEFKLTAEHKTKLLSDSVKNGFTSPSSYLTKLIEIGLPVKETIDDKLDLIAIKIDSLSSDILKNIHTISTNLKTGENDINRMQSLDKKIDTLSGNILNILNTISSNLKTFEGDINLRTFLTFKIAAFILARTFLIKKGAISDNANNEVNRFLHNETSNFENESGTS